jgi:hypothetical protein
MIAAGQHSPGQRVIDGIVTEAVALGVQVQGLEVPLAIHRLHDIEIPHKALMITDRVNQQPDLILHPHLIEDLPLLAQGLQTACIQAIVHGSLQQP